MGDWKTRLSLLWVINAVSGVSFLILDLFRSGNLNQIAGGIAINDWSLLLLSILVLEQLVMAFLSQVLTDEVNRWANIIVGAVIGIVTLVAFIGMVTIPSVLAINPASGFVFMVLIIRTAWKSKQ